MAEILVLIDHVEGAPKKVSYELLTLAKSLGEPSALILGKGAAAAADKVKAYGAEKIYVGESEDFNTSLAALRAAAVAQLIASNSPAAVLIPSNAEGKEVA